MHIQSRTLMLTSGIALASIGGLAVAGAVSAAVIALPIAHSANITPSLVTVLNVLPAFAPNFAPTLTLSLAPTIAVSPTITASPNISAPVLNSNSIGIVLPRLPGL